LPSGAARRIERAMDSAQTFIAKAPQIVIEPPRALDIATEIGLLEAAHARDPDALPLRARLADLLIERDRFDHAIALLADPSAQTAFPLVLALARALLARKGPGDDHRAAQVVEQSLALAGDDRQMARALAEQGKALARLGREDEAEAAFEQAFALDPQAVSVFKRWSAQQLRRGHFKRVAAVTEELIADGIVHSRVLAARSLALAAGGEIGAAQNLVGLDRFVGTALLRVPAGWPDHSAFNAQVARELLANAGLRYQRFGTASLETWRVDSPATGEVPAIRALLGAIAAAAEEWIAALPAADHPWLKARPARLELRCWAVITEGAGREQWHMHPFGWLSGGYYVAVPEPVEAGDDPAGCLAFGLPGGHIGVSAAERFGEMLVRPRAGLLSLFPSHAYHSTLAHGAEGKRICLAFDLCPV
jgi:tetratricopeptide (TPR) repeat protein